MPEPSASATPARRLLWALAWVAASAVLLGIAMEAWQISMNRRFAGQIEQWLQGDRSVDDDVDLPWDSKEKALLRAIRMESAPKRVVKVDPWSRGGWMTFCVADTRAYEVVFAVHVQGGRIIDVSSRDPALCLAAPAPASPAGGAT